MTESERELPAQSARGDVIITLVTHGEIYSVSRLVGTNYGYPNIFVETKLKVDATTRNWNVVSKIGELLDR